MLYNYTFRLRSVGNVLDEITVLVEKYRAKEIFDDLDTWPSNSRWAKDFCKGMIERGLNERVVWSINAKANHLLDFEMLKVMKRAGCRLLKIGVESASDETLRRIRKGETTAQIRNAVKLCHEAGLTVHLTAMLGYPWETRADVLNTIHFIRSLKPDSAQFSIVTPYPGTELYEQSIENSWFTIDPHEWDLFDMSRPVLRTEGMLPDDVVRLCEEAWKSIYFDCHFIWRQIFKIRSLSQLKLLYRGGKSVMATHVAGLKHRRAVRKSHNEFQES